MVQTAGPIQNYPLPQPHKAMSRQEAHDRIQASKKRLHDRALAKYVPRNHAEKEGIKAKTYDPLDTDSRAKFRATQGLMPIQEVGFQQYQERVAAKSGWPSDAVQNAMIMVVVGGVAYYVIKNRT